MSYVGYIRLHFSADNHADAVQATRQAVELLSDRGYLATPGPCLPDEVFQAEEEDR